MQEQDSRPRSELIGSQEVNKGSGGHGAVWAADGCNGSAHGS